MKNWKKLGLGVAAPTEIPGVALSRLLAGTAPVPGGLLASPNPYILLDLVDRPEWDGLAVAVVEEEPGSFRVVVGDPLILLKASSKSAEWEAKGDSDSALQRRSSWRSTSAEGAALGEVVVEAIAASSGIRGRYGASAAIARMLGLTTKAFDKVVHRGRVPGALSAAGKAGLVVVRTCGIWVAGTPKAVLSRKALALLQGATVETETSRPRPSLADLEDAVSAGESDESLGARYGVSGRQVRRWRSAYGLLRPSAHEGIQGLKTVPVGEA